MRPLLLAALLLTSSAATAQVTLEKRYGDMSPARLSTGELKYVVFTGNTLTVYNENHSLLRTITPPTMAGYQFVDALYLSDKTFNQDNLLEYVAYYDGTTTLPSGNRLARIAVLNENGVQLMQSDSTQDAYFARGNSGIKMITYTMRLDASGQQVGVARKVYAVGGTSLPTVTRTTAAAETDVAMPFPNPATERIQLPYQVQPGQQATLEVLDMAGRVVRRFTVDSAFDHLLLRADELRPGSYTYRVIGTTGSVAGKKFVVSR